MPLARGTMAAMALCVASHLTYGNILQWNEMIDDYGLTNRLVFFLHIFQLLFAHNGSFSPSFSAKYGVLHTSVWHPPLASCLPASASSYLLLRLSVGHHGRHADNRINIKINYRKMFDNWKYSMKGALTGFRFEWAFHNLVKAGRFIEMNKITYNFI